MAGVEVTNGLAAEAAQDRRRVTLAGALFFVTGVWSLLSLPIAEGMNPGYSVSSQSVSGLGVPYFSNSPTTCNTFPSCAIPVQPSSAVIVLSFFLGAVLMLWSGYLLWRVAAWRWFGIGVLAGGAFLLLVGVSYLPFYVGTPTSPTSGVVEAAIDLHLIGSISAFLLVIVLMFFAYRFTRGLFRYFSPVLGVVALAALLLFASGNYLGMGFGGTERVLIYSFDVWITGLGGYLLGGAGLRQAALNQ
jgi:hypothetical protein